MAFPDTLARPSAGQRGRTGLGIAAEGLTGREGVDMALAMCEQPVRKGLFSMRRITLPQKRAAAVMNTPLMSQEPSPS